MKLTTDGSKEMLTYGIIVENTSRYVAVNTIVKILISDASGHPIMDKVEDAQKVEREISLVLPGQRTGIGAITYPGRSGATELDVEIAKSQWWPRKNQGLEFAELEAGDVETDRTDEPRLGISFTVRSSYDEDIYSTAQAIFRDKSGAILGGTYGYNRRMYPPGVSEDMIEIPYGAPADIDDSRTEIYVTPGCC